jgi:hypothetical protein
MRNEQYLDVDVLLYVSQHYFSKKSSAHKEFNTLMLISLLSRSLRIIHSKIP